MPLQIITLSNKQIRKGPSFCHKTQESLYPVDKKNQSLVYNDLTCTDMNIFKGKSGVSMIGDTIQENTAINGVSYFSTSFRLLVVKLRIQISDLCEVTSYPAKTLSFSTKTRLSCRFPPLNSY